MATLADRRPGLQAERARGARLPAFIVMTDDERLPDALPLIPNLPAGSAVIVRARDPAALEARARALLGSCRRHSVRLLIAGDDGLARRLGADGVHLPESHIRRRPVRPAGPAGWIVTAAAHSEAAVRRAAGAGVDAVLLSPVFQTESHPDATPLGIVRFAALAGRTAVPVYALGGVGPYLRRLRAAGAAGFAGTGIAGSGLRRGFSIRKSAS